METLDRKTVVLAWLLRGIEDYFVAFSKFDQSFSRYRQLLNAMGFEMVCKAYLLAISASEYEGREEQQAIILIDKVAKSYGHDLKKLIEAIKGSVGKDGVEQLLRKKIDGFTGNQFVEVIKASYFESRYPVPNPIYKKFPIPEMNGLYWEPRYSSGMDKFCYASSRLLMRSLKSNFDLAVSEVELSKLVSGDAGRRISNLYFENNRSEFISETDC